MDNNVIFLKIWPVVPLYASFSVFARYFGKNSSDFELVKPSKLISYEIFMGEIPYKKSC